jgi:hypothetical protein
LKECFVSVVRALHVVVFGINGTYVQYKYFDNRGYIEDNNMKTTMKGGYVRIVYLNRLSEMLYLTAMYGIKLRTNAYIV